MPYPYSGSVYDQIAHGVTDIAFWRELVVRAAGPVLELGVGAGRLALELAPLAPEYHGLDSEPSMLAETARKSRERGVRLALHAGSFLALDALELGRAFALVLLPANTLSHVVTHADAERFFAGVRRHCAAGGCFALDTYNPRPWTRGPDPYTFGRYRDPADGGEIVVWSTPSYDAARQVAVHALEYRKGEEVVGRQTLEQRTYYPAELTAWMRWAGFREVSLFGDYNRGPFRGDSSRLIAVAV